MIRAGPAAGRRQQRGPKPLRLKQDSRRLNQKEDSHRSGFVIQDAGWGWGPASNGKTLFADLRDRVVGSVASGRSWSGDGSVVRGERCQRGEPDLTLRAVVAELAERGTPASYGAVWRFFKYEEITFKKSLHASEQDRADIARRRARWKAHQGRLHPKRLVFINEIWAKTNMTRRHGRCSRGARLVAKVPRGRWRAPRPLHTRGMRQLRYQCRLWPGLIGSRSS